MNFFIILCKKSKQIFVDITDLIAMPPQLGIILNEPKSESILAIYRFSVYRRESFTLLEPHKEKRNINFQINGAHATEKVVVRLFLDERKKVYKSRYYYLQKMDSEMAKYLAMALLQKLQSKLKFRQDHILKEVTEWL